MKSDIKFKIGDKVRMYLHGSKGAYRTGKVEIPLSTGTDSKIFIAEDGDGKKVWWPISVVYHCEFTATHNRYRYTLTPDQILTIQSACVAPSNETTDLLTIIDELVDYINFA